MSWQSIADASLAGDLITREQARAVLLAPDEELLDQLAAAYRVRRHYWGNRVSLHFLLNAQSGLCSEDCHYCSQSKLSTADIAKYPLLAREKILAAADRAATVRAGTFCLVISGRSPGERVFAKVLDAISEVKSRYDVRVCACLGLLNAEQTRRLKAAGADTINHNINTSPGFHPEICSTHTFADRVATIQNVHDAGLGACSGGIIGMGESTDDVIELALSLREVDAESVPVNFLIPIEGTPLAGHNELNPRYCLRVLCLFRFVLPSRKIRVAGGREYHLRSLQPLALYPANSMFIGDYLTTAGQSARADLEMIRDAGFVLEAPDGTQLQGDPLSGLQDVLDRLTPVGYASVADPLYAGIGNTAPESKF
jgi:biotin synthase